VGHKIVVGVDGSIDGQRALAWALDEAARHTSELLVVHAWEYPSATYVFPPGPQEGGAREVLAKSIEGLDAPNVDIRTRLVEGRPVRALVKESLDADMLVVGLGGRSGVAAVVLGLCQHRLHSPCRLPGRGGPSPTGGVNEATTCGGRDMTCLARFIDPRAGGQ
jgi:nucleotide-binding universal stress UspA family protein